MGFMALYCKKMTVFLKGTSLGDGVYGINSIL
jgi:hypothetical protein